MESDRETRARVYRIPPQYEKTKTGGWDRWRRVAAQAPYEELYCERGNMENRIKEQFSLFADQVSAGTIRANQMRLYLSAMAYILVSGLRRVGLKGTEIGAGAGLHDPDEAAEDRRTNPGFSPEGLGFDGVRLLKRH